MALNLKIIGCCTLTALALMGCQMTPHTQMPSKTVTLNAVTAQGIGAPVGTVTFTDTKQGLLIQPNLKNLPAGQRGFHIHEKASCEPDVKDNKPGAALKAGSHLDPQKAGAHGHPEGPGHLGDLPVLMVAADGTATTAVTAPRLTLAAIKDRSIMVHAGGDNYSDLPEPLGGGGARIACGVIR